MGQSVRWVTSRQRRILYRWMMAQRPILLLLDCLLFPSETRAAVSSAVHQGFTSPMISILDRDTLGALHDNHADRVRPGGIDCPEKGQAYGQRVKQAASALVFGRDVILQTHGQDKYGRTLADVLLP
jgi:micrococcal nuclease